MPHPCLLCQQPCFIPAPTLPAGPLLASCTAQDPPARPSTGHGHPASCQGWLLPPSRCPQGWDPHVSRLFPTPGLQRGPGPGFCGALSHAAPQHHDHATLERIFLPPPSTACGPRHAQGNKAPCQHGPSSSLPLTTPGAPPVPCPSSSHPIPQHQNQPSGPARSVCSLGSTSSPAISGFAVPSHPHWAPPCLSHG